MALPLMPKATAVWLVENTGLTFEQVGDFCGLHKLEVQAIADGEVAAGIIGMGSRRQQPAHRRGNQALRGRIPRPFENAAERPQPVARAKGPRYTPVSKRADKPDAVAYLVKTHSRTARRANRAPARHDQGHHRQGAQPFALERHQHQAAQPRDVRPVQAIRPRRRAETRSAPRRPRTQGFPARARRTSSTPSCRNPRPKRRTAFSTSVRRGKNNPTSIRKPCSVIWGEATAGRP